MALAARFDYKPEVAAAVDRSEPGLLLTRLFELAPERRLRVMPDRATLLVRLPSLEDGARVVLKRYEGGAGRDGWRERLSGRSPRSPGRREFDVLEELRTVGVRVPRALRWAENREASALTALGGARRGRSAVVMECVEHREDARGALARLGPADRRALERSVLRLVRRLHERGWFHRDLYLQHFLLPGEDATSEPVLVDVGRARWARRPGRRWLVKDLAALHLSAPAQVTRAERLRFLLAWLDGQGRRERLAWKRWARSVVAKARRLGAHVPKHEDPDQRVGVPPEAASCVGRSSSGGDRAPGALGRNSSGVGSSADDVDRNASSVDPSASSVDPSESSVDPSESGVDRTACDVDPSARDLDRSSSGLGPGAGAHGARPDARGGCGG